MRNAMEQTARLHPTTSPRVLKRSDKKDTPTVVRKAAAYGGTVKSCARKPVYPSPTTIVGEKRDREAIKQPTPV